MGPAPPTGRKGDKGLGKGPALGAMRGPGRQPCVPTACPTACGTPTLPRSGPPRGKGASAVVCGSPGPEAGREGHRTGHRGEDASRAHGGHGPGRKEGSALLTGEVHCHRGRNGGSGTVGSEGPSGAGVDWTAPGAAIEEAGGETGLAHPEVSSPGRGLDGGKGPDWQRSCSTHLPWRGRGTGAQWRGCRGILAENAKPGPSREETPDRRRLRDAGPSS